MDTSPATKAAADGPVFINDRGKPMHVLLSMEECPRPTDAQRSIIDRLGLPPGIEDVALEIPPMRDLPISPQPVCRSSTLGTIPAQPDAQPDPA